jgi:hypothetical protein
MRYPLLNLASRSGVVAATVIALTAAAGSAEGSALDRFDRNGITFEYPNGWFVTTEALSNGINPKYRFTVSTTPVSRTREDVGPCLAGIAKQVSTTTVLAYLREGLGDHRRSALPRMQPRPRHFRMPTRTDNSLLCFGPGGRWISFRANGRAFYLGLYVGPNASPSSVRALSRLVDRMQIDSRLDEPEGRPHPRLRP